MAEEFQLGEVSALVAELTAAAELIGGRMYLAMMNKHIERATAKAMSPFVDREGAAAFAQCSTSEIDRAAGKLFNRYERGNTPVFLKDEIKAAIINGKWKK